MLLVHGLGGCREMWDPVLPLLGAFEAAAIDLPGFGTAPALEVEPTHLALADAVEQWMDARGWEQAHLVGNSLGGLIVLELARRGRALTVTALSPGGMAMGWEDRWAHGLIRFLHAGGRLLLPAMPRLSRSAPGRRLMLGTTVARPDALTPDLALRLAAAFAESDAVGPVLDALDSTPTIDNLGDITCPVTIAWGSRDVLLLPRQGVRYVKAIPGARLIRLDKLGHVPMSDDPGLVAKVIRDTAASAPTRSGA